MTGADRLQQEGDVVSAFPIAEAIDVSKRYGPTVALRNATVRIVPGGSHGLVGRNGAGKSTMVGILTGLRKPDSGEVRFAGQPAPPLSDRDAWRRNVACVYQHATIIPALTVAENLFINRQPVRFGAIDWGGMRRDARALLDRWRVSVPVDQRAGDLSVEARQLVEIARALSHGSRFIILDEPTAQLDRDEIKRLYRRIRELQDEGVAFLFISHHLQEVYDLCQTVTVLRDAQHILTTSVATLPKTQLIQAMTGDAVLAAETARVAPPAPGAPLLEVRSLAGADYSGVSLAVAAGEIVGITGSTSSGRAAVAEAVAGFQHPVAGSIEVGGAAMKLGDVPSALALGIGCVPQERHRRGLVLGQSIAENATMTIPDRLGRFGFIAPGRKDAVARESIQTFAIVASSPDQAVSGLSGGNQQKVVMARALASAPRILVLIDPTAGVDVRSKAQLLDVVEAQRAAGKAVLLSSGELDDLRVCDRVLVMHRGTIAAEFERGWREADMIASIEGVENHG